MNQEWYRNLDNIYGNTKVKDLPLPVNGVPMSAEEYDYKTYYVRRRNRARIEGNEEKEGKVYLISDNSTQMKIGISRDVGTRLRTLQTSSGKELTLISVYEPVYVDYTVLERKLHHYFKNDRILGEWFSINLTEDEFLEICEKLDI